MKRVNEPASSSLMYVERVHFGWTVNFLSLTGANAGIALVIIIVTSGSMWVFRAAVRIFGLRPKWVERRCWLSLRIFTRDRDPALNLLIL
jgi:hypothetical protein